MGSDLARVEPLTAGEIQAQVNRMQEVMVAVMKDKVHYGIIKGCGNKPTLFKPGAEKIMATFRLAADPIVEDLSGPDIIRYRVKVNMLTPDGGFVGAGIGECSSDEEKYKWRASVCDEEFEATEIDRRRDKWKPGWDGPATSIRQVRTNPADIANTVLKMAKKRALVDGVLTATGASDIFEQDIEDLPDGMLEDREDAPSKTSTVKKAAGKKAELEDKRTVQQRLGDELHAYCGGDEPQMKKVLKDISCFKPKDGDEKFLTSVKTASDKWAKTSLEKLRKLVKGGGTTEPAPKSKHPEGCTEKPNECEHTVWKAGVAFCGDMNTACAFWDAEPRF